MIKIKKVNSQSFCRSYFVMDKLPILVAGKIGVSLQAKGVLAIIMAILDENECGYKITIEDIKFFCKEEESEIVKAIEELEEHGYICVDWGIA